MVRFLLNQQLVSLTAQAPTQSVLDYLRTSLALVGTKEGCAAGDCGACTVVLGELHHNTLRYRAVNACITPVASLHGKQLLTVEHLRQTQHLHPVQQAMVDSHGSQCGFCTPGIVMSLFAWWKNQALTPALATRHGVEVALSGNLCRCTGYQAVFRAAEQTLAQADDDQFRRDLAATIAQLEAIQQGPAGYMAWAELAFFIPQSAAEVAALLSQHPKARLVAGATDLSLDYTQQLQPPSSLIYLGNVQDCRTIILTSSAVGFGAGLSFSDILPTVAEHYPAFATLLTRLGSLQIRNQATLGGNIANASPIGDTLPVLLALGAEVELFSHRGSRRVACKDFFTGYRQTQLAADEFIHRVWLPRLAADETLQVYKISKRFDDDISAVCVAIWLQRSATTITAARLGFGGMAAVPARAPAAEAELLGKPFSETTFQAAGHALAQDFTPLDDVRASQAYRLAVAGKLLQRAYWEVADPNAINLFATHQAGAITGGFYHA